MTLVFMLEERSMKELLLGLLPIRPQAVAELSANEKGAQAVPQSSTSPSKETP